MLPGGHTYIIFCMTEQPPTHESNEMINFKDMKTLLRCMTFMASADGKLREEEVDLIVTVYKRLLGRTIDRSIVSKLFDQVSHDEQFKLFDDLSIARSLDMETKTLIIKACYLLEISDREAADAESEALSSIAAALELSDNDFIRIIREISI